MMAQALWIRVMRRRIPPQRLSVDVATPQFPPGPPTIYWNLCRFCIFLALAGESKP
jgi:hypothetical protein